MKTIRRILAALYRLFRRKPVTLGSKLLAIHMEATNRKGGLS